MDKTLRTIGEEIRKNREGIIPALTLVIDTNIIADHAWARDSNVTHLIETIVPDHPEFLIVVPSPKPQDYADFHEKLFRDWSR